MVICLERGADLHMAQLMPLPLTVSCFNKIQIGFTFLVPAHQGSPGKGPMNGCVYVCVPQAILLQRRSDSGVHKKTNRIVRTGAGKSKFLGFDLKKPINVLLFHVCFCVLKNFLRGCIL